MTARKSIGNREWKLMNALADSVIELSEEEILAEEREAGADPTDEAARVRAIFDKDPVREAPYDRRRPLRIVIADDHPIFRDGLRRLLDAEANLKVLGEAGDGGEAVRLARQLKPDILLLDLAMPRHPGLEALRELSTPAEATPVRVILLTGSPLQTTTRATGGLSRPESQSPRFPLRRRPTDRQTAT